MELRLRGVRKAKGITGLNFLDVVSILERSNTDSADVVIGTAGVLNVKAFNAKGDGVSDDTLALQTVLNMVRDNGPQTVYVPLGTYVATSQLTLYAGTELVFANGAVIDGTAITNGQVFNTSGSTGDSGQVALTADCAKGATTLTIAAGAETAFAVGGYVKIGSQKQWSADVAQADASMDGWRGEIGIVTAVASGLLTVKMATWDAYAVSDSAFVAPMTMIEGITLRGKGKIKGAGLNGACRGMKLDRCLRLRINDVEFDDFDDAALQIKDGYDVVVDNITVNGGSSNQNSFYGISWQFACQFATMINCTFRDVRHSATLDQINLVRAGVPRHVAYVNCKAYNTKAASFDAHAFGEFLTVQGCHSYGSQDHGISVRSPSALIISNTIEKCAGMGIYLRNQTSEPSRYLVVGNVIRRAALNGINWRTPPEAALAATTAGQVIDGVVIADNIIVDPGNEGIICQSAAGFTNLYAGLVKGNVVQYTGANAQNGISLIRCTNTTVAGNVVKGANVGLAIDNNCVGVQRFGNTYPNCATGLSAGSSTPTPTPVGSLAVGNAVAATTPGSVVKKIQVFDEAGASLGFIPVYSTIT